MYSTVLVLIISIYNFIFYKNLFIHSNWNEMFYFSDLSTKNHIRSLYVLNPSIIFIIVFVFIFQNILSKYHQSHHFKDLKIKLLHQCFILKPETTACNFTRWRGPLPCNVLYWRRILKIHPYVVVSGYHCQNHQI